MNYTQLKKDELVKVLKERDAAIAGLEETNALLTKENDDYCCKVTSLTKDCEGMTEKCNTLRNKVNGLKDDVELANLSVKNLTTDNNNLKSEVNSCKLDLTIKDGKIHSLKHRHRIITVILIIAVIVAVIF